MSKQQSGDPQTIIRVESVVSLFRRAKIVFASSLFLGVLIFLFLVYIPFSNVLEESLITNFEQIAMANYHVLDGSIKRSVEGANSLSSRTMIKNAAEDFQKGLITFEELADYTQPKYEGTRGDSPLVFSLWSYVANRLKTGWLKFYRNNKSKFFGSAINIIPITRYTITNDWVVKKWNI